MTPEQVDDLLYEAAKTERMLPAVRQSAKLTYWPETTAKDWLNYASETTRIKLTPSPAQISDYETAINLLTKLPKIIDRQLVWARACGLSWARLGRQLGVDYRTVKRQHQDALVYLSRWTKRHMPN